MTFWLEAAAIERNLGWKQSSDANGATESAPRWYTSKH